MDGRAEVVAVEEAGGATAGPDKHVAAGMGRKRRSGA